MANARKRPSRSINKQINKRKPKKCAKKIQIKLTPLLSRWLMGFSGLLFFIGASFWCYFWFSNPVNLSIDKVKIQGELNHITQEEVREKLNPLIETNLFLLDEAQIITELENEPWIRQVSLRKIWPKQLEVHIKEQVPVAFWGKGRLLNQYGEIFKGELPDKKGVFPYLESPKDNGRELGERYVYLQRLLNKTPLEIMELTEDDTGVWRVRFRQGPVLIIGRKEHEKRIERFKIGYLQGLKDNFTLIRKIDLRYTNGFAVEWKQTPKSS